MAMPRWVAPVLVALLAFGLFGTLFSSFPVLYDTDSYFHLAVARVYATVGVVDELPWARFSLLRDGFGDKEFLFHALTVPFASAGTAGGRWALAFWNALLVGVLAALGRRAIGRWGLALPLLVYLGSLDFLGRAIRLRPELFAVSLVLIATWCVGRGRYRWLGAVACVFALSYTAFHALLGLAGLWFLQRGWMRRRWEWQLLAYPVLGVGLGLWLHPHFPFNLVVWKVQSIDFFQYKATLDVGTEIGAQSADQLLLLNLAGLLALAVIWASRTAVSAESEKEAGEKETGQSDATMADAVTVAALAWCGLYVLMLRFSTYAVPFLALALLFELRRRGLRPGAWMRLPGRGRLPLAFVLLVPLLLGGWRTTTLLTGLANSSGGELEREEDWAAFGQSLPPGARVAAEWGTTHVYMWFAPQALYLNVLDPVFLAVPSPRQHSAQRAIFNGTEPDIPFVLRRDLDSDFLALSRFHREPEVLARLAADPRLVPRYAGYTLLYEVAAASNADFLLDWRQVPRGTGLPPAPETDLGEWRPYPRADTEALRTVEGFVDATRLDSFSRCVAMVAEPEVDTATEALWELAPAGPTTLWIDGEMVASTAEMGAILGRGVTFPVHLSPGRHRVTALTCRGEESGRSGFYLLERRPMPAGGTPAGS